MAELTVLNIAKLLLEQLSSPAKDELLLLWNSKKDLKKLEYTISTIKDVLHDADQRQATDGAVRRWILRLRDAFYKADDLFDTISARALRKRVIHGNEVIGEIRLFFSKLNLLFFSIKTAHEVKDLRVRLDDIAKDIRWFNFIKSTINDERPSTTRRTQSHAYIREDKIIGREKDKEEIVSMLLADADVKDHVSVIAVDGIGGLGKTALAQLVYSAREVLEFFDIRIWACVNYFSDLNEALEKIIASGTYEKHSGLQLDQLQSMLRRKIHGKRFFLVLDDVCDHARERWLTLKDLMDAGERGSKILVTTRSKEVAQNLATVRPCYALGGLTDEHAWSLFKKMAFDCNEEEDIREKEALGRQIVKKCANVPLAIRTVGSFLYHKDKKQWSEFVNNELMKVIPNNENMIMQVLKISYDDLPPALKHCFAYWSVFPKGWRLNKISLILLWMAEGLLETSSENQCLEDIGENYFSYLLQRCFFQDATKDSDGGIISCIVHDLFHDLAVQIAGDECCHMTNIPDDFRGKSHRHMLVEEIKDSLFEVKGVRSLMCSKVGYVERASLDGLFLHLTSLRALYLLRLDIEEIPSSIGKLVHLRYLDLRKSQALIRLPDALCKLQNLLTLRLSGCFQLKKLPDDLQKLIRLRHLEIAECNKLNHMPSRLENMTSLVRLDRLVVNKDHGRLRCLKRLDNLRGSIEIQLPGDQWKDCVADAEESMLRCKTKLSRLAIKWDHPTEGEAIMSEVDADAILHGLQPPDSIDCLEVDNFPGKKFPVWLSSLENLVKLALKNCHKCLELPHLRQLFQLKRLILNSIPLLEYLEEDICNDSRSFFPSLESVVLVDMPSLKGWWKPAGEEVGNSHLLSFTRLSKLFVSDCLELTCLPLCPSVERLDFINVNMNLLKQLVSRTPKTMEPEANSSLVPSSSAHQACCRLKFIRIERINDLAFLPDEFKQLSTLPDLRIIDCPKLKRRSLLSSLQHLTALECFIFTGSWEIDLDNDENQEKDGMPWISLTRLRQLAFEFGNDPQGAHLIKGLHHLTTLEFLDIHKDVPEDNESQWTAPPNLKNFSMFRFNEVARLSGIIQQLKRLENLGIMECNVDAHELDKLPWEDLKSLRRLVLRDMPMMKSLPDKPQHLPALASLEITRCPEVISLPDWISRLRTLQITECPILKERCKRPRGSCWPLIQDILYLQIS